MNNKKYILISIIISTLVILIISYYNFPSFIINLSDYYNIEYSKIIYDLDEEVDKTIRMDINQYAELIEITDRSTAFKDDFVLFESVSYIDSKLHNNIPELLIKLGSGKFNDQFENELIGKSVNEEIVFDLIVPDSYFDKKLVGKKITYNVKIKSINKFIFPELSDEFVNINFGYENVNVYYEMTNKIVKESKDYDVIITESNEILTQIVKNSIFFINEKEYRKKYNDLVNSEIEIAKFNNMDFTDYLYDCGKTEEEFYNECSESAKNSMKMDLVIDEIIKRENLDVSYDEINNINSTKTWELRIDMDNKIEYNLLKKTLLHNILRKHLVEISIPKPQ